MMLGSNKFDPMIPTDFFVFHTLEILKTFEIRSFFKEKRLLSHVLAEPKTYFCEQKYVFKPLWSQSHKNVCKHTFYDHLTLVSYTYIIILICVEFVI